MKKIAILLMVISSSLYAQVSPVHVLADWVVYSHDNYSIQYPATWELEENLDGTIFAIISPVDTANPKFTRNINLIIQDLKGQGIDLDKYNDISLKQIKDNLPNDTIITDERGTDKIGEYRHIIYVGDENNNHLQFEQYYRIINEKAYILTLTMHRKQWDKSHLLGENILKTFTVK